jgi:hypothetical protein
LESDGFVELEFRDLASFQAAGSTNSPRLTQMSARFVNGITIMTVRNMCNILASTPALL